MNDERRKQIRDGLLKFSKRLGEKESCNKMSFTASTADVRMYTEAVSSCRHPEKGRILFAARDIEKGELLAVAPRSSIVSRSFEDVAEFRRALAVVEDKNEYLQHWHTIQSTNLGFDFGWENVLIFLILTWGTSEPKVK